VFCYLCIKGAAETTGYCPLCRADIGKDFNSREHQVLGKIKLPSSKNGNYWFYAGFRGWWLYDADTNSELEKAYEEKHNTLDVFIAGRLYVVDFVHMAQRRKSGEPGRVRRVRRGTLDLDDILGIAGLKGSEVQQAIQMMRRSDSKSAEKCFQ